MQLNPTFSGQCNSTMINSFEYDQTQRILRVYFRLGQIYDYFFVPVNIAQDLKNISQGTESVGTWFANNIRMTYEYQKIKG